MAAAAAAVTQQRWDDALAKISQLEGNAADRSIHLKGFKDFIDQVNGDLKKTHTVMQQEHDKIVLTKPTGGKQVSAQ